MCTQVVTLTCSKYVKSSHSQHAQVALQNQSSDDDGAGCTVHCMQWYLQFKLGLHKIAGVCG